MKSPRMPPHLRPSFDTTGERMPAAGRSLRRYGIVAASVAVHAVVLGLLALHVPRLRTPAPQPGGPPEAIIPVLIMPRALPPSADAGTPSPLRLHRRRTRYSDAPLPVAPLLAPQAAPEPAQAPTPTGPRTLLLPRYEDTLADNARRALRGRLNCDSPSLTRAEREACMERFASGARSAPALGLGIEPGKESDLARAARRKEEDYEYKRAPVPPGNCASRVTDCLGNDRPQFKTPF